MTTTTEDGVEDKDEEEEEDDNDTNANTYNNDTNTNYFGLMYLVTDCQVPASQVSQTNTEKSEHLTC